MNKVSFAKKAISSVALATFLATSTTACGPTNTLNPDLASDQVSSLAKKTLPAGAKKWTILVHLAADNNLHGFGLKDMAEMAYGIKDSNDVNFIVLWDGAKTGDSAVYEIKHNDKKPVMNAAITSPKVANPLIPASNEVDSGDPKLFAKFLDWGTKTYPAEHTGVIIWNHGSGIFRNGKNKPQNGEFVSNGFAWDDHGTNMNMKDLNPAFSAAMANTGKKIDFLDFDACLMAHVESAYQVKDQVDYLVASEMVEAGDGNDYIGITNILNKNPDISGRQMASDMVDVYAKSYLPGGNQYTNPREEYTMSAADVSAVVNDLVPAINELATEMVKNPSSVKSSRMTATTYENADSVDLGHFLNNVAKNVTEDISIKQKASQVTTALKKAVIRERHTGSTNALGDSTGLVIYFPEPGDSINSKYLNPAEIKLSEHKPWGEFLKAFTKSSK